MEIGRAERERETVRKREKSADERCCHGEGWMVVVKRGGGSVKGWSGSVS